MKTLSIMTLVVLGGLVAQAQAGGNCCCGECGCAKVRKVCRLVPDVKMVTTFEYDMKCEDFCLPGKSCKLGTKCVPDCTSWHGCHKETIWKPSCGCVKTRNVLVKVPVTKEVHGYKCVVECVCCGCGVAKVDEKATQEALEQGIMPASAEEPIVLEEPADETAGAEQPVAASQEPAESSALRKFFK
jgi:hypothetical protein